MKINLKKIIIYLYAFILIYSPNFSYLIKINNFILFGFFTAFYIIYYLIKKEKKYFSYFNKKPIFIFILFNILATLYFVIRTLIAGANLTDFYNLRIIQGLMPILYLAGSLIVYNELNTLNYDKEHKYLFIINVAVIQSVIAILMIFLPTLRDIALNIFYSNHEYNIYLTRSRLYGICDGDYTYGLQILHSIFALFTSLYAFFYKKKKYFLFSILILSVTFLNGRSGLIIYVAGMLVFLLYIGKNMNLIKMFKIAFIIILLLGLIVFGIYSFLPNTFVLISHAYNDILSFALAQDTSSETATLFSMFFLPTGISLIFGCGFRVFAQKGKSFGFTKVSDVGFVNDVFMGGFIYIFLLYFSYLQLITKVKKMSPKKSFEKAMCNVLIVSIALSNIKGEVFRSNMLTTAMIIIIIFMLLNINTEKKNL